jgi:hypothetical protein
MHFLPFSDCYTFVTYYTLRARPFLENGNFKVYASILGKLWPRNARDYWNGGNHLSDCSRNCMEWYPDDNGKTRSIIELCVNAWQTLKLHLLSEEP